MALFLRDEEVNQAVNMDEMLVAIEDMQRHYGHGEVMNLGRRKIIAPGGLLSVMGGGLFYDGILGVKTYTVVQGKYSFQVSIYNADFLASTDVLQGAGQPLLISLRVRTGCHHRRRLSTYLSNPGRMFTNGYHLKIVTCLARPVPHFYVSSLRRSAIRCATAYPGSRPLSRRGTGGTKFLSDALRISGP